MSHIQTIFLALIQGLTEFLPISSSAHLILPSQLLGWNDQGILFDVCVHFGTLLAVIIYFRKEIYEILFGTYKAILKRKPNEHSKLFGLLHCSTSYTQYKVARPDNLHSTLPLALSFFLI